MFHKYIRVELAMAAALISINSIYAQHKEQFQFDHRAVYEMTYLSDSLDQQSQKQQMTELLIGDEVSLFRTAQKANDDARYMSYINTKVITMSEPRVFFMGDINAFNYQITKDYASGQTKVYDEYTGSTLNNLQEITYYVEPEEAMSNWTLKSDTTTIDGHLCQRADIDFGGRKWIAWFSPELSDYADGPYKFKGLPGLILRVYDANKTWCFELVELSNIDTIVPINFKDGLQFSKTTKQKLYKNRRHYQKNMIEIQETAGNHFGDSRARVKNDLEHFIVKDNNWIELDF